MLTYFKLILIVTCFLSKEANAGHPTGSGTSSCDGQLSNASLNLTNETSSCRVHILEEENLCGMLLEEDYQLLEYTLHFPHYESSPISLKTDQAYQLNRWQHIFTKHGETLLSLTFNYDILSMSFLSFGVETKEIDVVDEPWCCVGSLSDEGKASIVKDILVAKFLVHSQCEGWSNHQGRVCHHVIEESEKELALKYQCCKFDDETNKTECSTLLKNKWVAHMYKVINSMDILFLLFGPMLALKLFAGKSFRVVEYIVKLKEADKRTILKQLDDVPSDTKKGKVKKPDKAVSVKESTDIATSRLEVANKGRIQKSQYSTCLSQIPANKESEVVLNRLCIQVDHRRLMSEEDVAVGPLKFLWIHFVLCKLNRYHPFKNCCMQSMFGSWAGRILCMTLPQENVLRETSVKISSRCKLPLSWHTIFRSLGMVIAVLLLPFPYYIRKIVYIYFEREEYEARREVMAEGGKYFETTIHFSQDTIQQICDVCFFAYICSMFLLVIAYSFSEKRLTNLTNNILQDFKHIRRLQCIRLYFTHLILPFEIFGIVGIFMAPLYWLVTLPIVTCVAVFYCVPTVYLLGRFLIGTLPPSVHRYVCFGKRRLRERGKTDAIEKTFLLRSISAAPEYAPAVKPLGSRMKWWHRTQDQYPCIIRFLIGLVLSACLLSVLIMYAECFRFIFEVTTLTLMGAIVNAGSAGKFFMLAFFLVTYTCQVFNNVTDKYQILLSAIFDYIQQKLEDSVMDVINLSGSEQKNMAFKYFSPTDIDEAIRKQKEACVLNMDLSKSDEYWEERRKNYKDRVEIKQNILHWKIHSLIFFVDRYDIPRIPKALFRQISNLRLKGCPGPVYENLLQALRELLYMLFFLFFVMVVVLAFGDAYEVSSGSQLLITLAGGFVPVLATKFLKPKGVKLNLSTYSFQGKVNEIIRDFNQSWPMTDLPFEPNLHHSEDDIHNAASHDVTDDVMTEETTSSQGQNVKSKIETSKFDDDGDMIEEIRGIQVHDGKVDLVLNVQKTAKTFEDDASQCTIS